MKFIVVLIFQFSIIANAAPGLSSEFITDVFKNRSLSVDSKNSNSPGCENSCSLENYFKIQMNNISEDLAGTNSNPKIKVSSSCSKIGKPHAYREFLKDVSKKIPSEKTTFTCKFELSYENGESVWSESLYYLKDKKTNRIVADSLWAFGTP